MNPLMKIQYVFVADDKEQVNRIIGALAQFKHATGVFWIYPQYTVEHLSPPDVIFGEQQFPYQTAMETYLFHVKMRRHHNTDYVMFASNVTKERVDLLTKHEFESLEPDSQMMLVRSNKLKIEDDDESKTTPCEIQWAKIMARPESFIKGPPISPVPPIYCLSVNNPKRKQTMLQRFQAVHVAAEFPAPVYVNPNDRNNSCMRNHIGNHEAWLKSDNKSDVAVFCEDDVYLRKSFRKDLIVVAKEFRRLNLKVLLLGYLHLNPKPHPEILQDSFSYLHFDNETWGTQMYMITRSYAEFLVKNYSVIPPEGSKPPYSADWIITKPEYQHRVRLYPMLAVEEGEIADKTALGHVRFHQACKDANYDPTIHV